MINCSPFSCLPHNYFQIVPQNHKSLRNLVFLHINALYIRRSKILIRKGQGQLSEQVNLTCTLHSIRGFVQLYQNSPI